MVDEFTSVRLWCLDKSAWFIEQPLTGWIEVGASSVPIASIDLELCRVEGCTSSEGQNVSVGRCRLTSGCPRVDRAWFQRLKLKRDEALSLLSFNFNLRSYMSETSTVQFTQIAEGNVNLGLRIPIHVVLPRLYCCPSVQARTFSVSFLVRILVGRCSSTPGRPRCCPRLNAG
jgi:hypothetical protein